MATDLTIDVEDEPSELARLAQVLGGAGVNIEGFCAVTSGGGQAEIHVLVEEAADALTALGAAGLEVRFEQEVAVVALEDRPGALGEMTRRLGGAGINLTLAYLATNTRLVFAADNLDEARDVLD
ncbi:MAG TPA: amino acid-binding protein [Acidimicrobiia bacterium]|nr:amino acid-binding protein [Acidimicrobiia bacterium]